jgi:hypothetical protein
MERPAKKFETSMLVLLEMRRERHSSSRTASKWTTEGMTSSGGLEGTSRPPERHGGPAKEPMPAWSCQARARWPLRPPMRHEGRQ